MEKRRCSVKILGESLESNVVAVEIRIHGMVNIGDIVFHATWKKKNTTRKLLSEVSIRHRVPALE